MFNYHQPNVENMQNYLNQENEKSGGEGPNWWSIPSGMSSVRILPPWDPTGRVALPVYSHPIEFKGEGMSYTKYNWTCVSKTENKRCAICEGLASLRESGINTENWEANRRQFYFNAIVMHDPTYDAASGKGTAPGTHVLMKGPKTLYDWIISQITNPMIGDITSVTNGIDVYITKEGTGLGTSYNMTLSPNGRTPIPEEYLSKITELYNLDDIFGSGFEQEQVDELVNHLRRSAGVFNNNLQNTVSQMAGYPQQVPPAQPQVGSYTPPASPFAQPSVAPATPVASQAPTPPWVADSVPSPVPTPPPVAPTPQVAPATSNAGEGQPKCFGQYDSGSVNCVVCPFEIPCSQSK